MTKPVPFSWPNRVWYVPLQKLELVQLRFSHVEYGRALYQGVGEAKRYKWWLLSEQALLAQTKVGAIQLAIDDAEAEIGALAEDLAYYRDHKANLEQFKVKHAK